MKKSIIILVVAAVLAIGFLIFRAKTANNQNVTQPPPPPTGSPIDISNWKTYKNLGLELRYLPNWTLGENPPNIPSGVRLWGDGYLFIIESNSAGGEFPNAKVVEVEVDEQIIQAGEVIDSEGYHLVLTLNRIDGNGFYFLRLNADQTVSVEEAKSTIKRFLDTIKIVNL